MTSPWPHAKPSQTNGPGTNRGLSTSMALPHNYFYHDVYLQPAMDGASSRQSTWLADLCNLREGHQSFHYHVYALQANYVV